MLKSSKKILMITYIYKVVKNLPLLTKGFYLKKTFLLAIPV